MKKYPKVSELVKDTSVHLTSNPSFGKKLTDEQFQAAFDKLLKDPDPQSMIIAQDMVLESGRHLDELGGWMALGEGYSIARRGPPTGSPHVAISSSLGAFILKPLDKETLYVFWWVIPILTSPKLEPIRGGRVMFSVGVGDQRWDFGGGGFSTVAEAQREAVLRAWWMAKRLKGVVASTMPKRGTLRESLEHHARGGVVDYGDPLRALAVGGDPTTRQNPAPATEPVVHLPLHEIPAVITDSNRYVLKTHGYTVVDKHGNALTSSEMQALLREFGRNAAQALMGSDTNPENQ